MMQERSDKFIAFPPTVDFGDTPREKRRILLNLPDLGVKSSLFFMVVLARVLLLWAFQHEYASMNGRPDMATLASTRMSSRGSRW
jgi:hypothetical protein